MTYKEVEEKYNCTIRFTINAKQEINLIVFDFPNYRYTHTISNITMMRCSTREIEDYTCQCAIGGYMTYITATQAKEPGEVSKNAALEDVWNHVKLTGTIKEFDSEIYSKRDPISASYIIGFDIVKGEEPTLVVSKIQGSQCKLIQYIAGERARLLYEALAINAYNYDIVPAEPSGLEISFKKTRLHRSREIEYRAHCGDYHAVTIVPDEDGSGTSPYEKDIEKQLTAEIERIKNDDNSRR